MNIFKMQFRGKPEHINDILERLALIKSSVSEGRGPIPAPSTERGESMIAVIRTLSCAFRHDALLVKPAKTNSPLDVIGLTDTKS